MSTHKGEEVHELVGGRKVTYDFMGSPEASRRWNQERKHFLEQITKHYRKSNDYTVIDLTDFTDDQIRGVAEHVAGLPSAARRGIWRVGW
ncbi:MAG: hypothetical protein ACK2U9_11925 [Anaerolineae bacterium]